VALRDADLAGMPLIPCSGAEELRARCSKRAIDLVVGLLAVLAMAPSSWRRQWRSSWAPTDPCSSARRGRRNGEMFRIWKFRTMVVDAEQQYAELKA